MNASRRPRTTDTGADLGRTSPRGAPGRRALTDGLGPRRAPAAAGPTAGPPTGPAPAPTPARVEDDPFGLHLPPAETRFVDDDGAPPTDAALDDVEAIAVELERLIERAEWSKLRPEARAEFAPGTAARAQARRRGEAPDLSGTGSVVSMDRLAAGVRALQATWPTLTPKARADALRAIGDAVLVGADVPPLLGITVTALKAFTASFDYRTWKIELLRELVVGTALDDVAAVNLADALAHELRHAEQQFLVARSLAAQGLNADEIRGALNGLEPTVSVRAVAMRSAGLDPAQVALAARMEPSLLANREITRRLDADNGLAPMAASRARAVAVVAGLRARPPRATLAEGRAACRDLLERIDHVLTNYRLYRQFAGERDAHEVGAGASLAFEAQS
ncbi:MAG: hypothetical protein IPH44_00805 [Myxococcales bacterium]|nr:hypothetical protein [Myxococcales bacterium]